MAIPTSIADLTWLLDSEPAGAPFARGAAAGSAIANTWLNSRRVGMQQGEMSEELRIKKAEEARKAQESAIQFAGFQDYQNAVKTGMPPDEAVKKFGASMFYKSPTFPNFLSAQERAQISAERASDLARHQTNLLLEKKAARDDAKSEFDQTLLETTRRFDEREGERTRQFEKTETRLNEALKQEKELRTDAEKGRNARAVEANLLKRESLIGKDGRVISKGEFISRHFGTAIRDLGAKNGTEANKILSDIYDEGGWGSQSSPSKSSGARATVIDPKTGGHFTVPKENLPKLLERHPDWQAIP